MTITKSRGATKRLGPISMGSKIVRFRVKNIDRRFTVHEDLICKTSKFFKDRLQKARKPVKGECFVCTEDLDPKIKDLTFCAMCGQNVHVSCIERWKQTASIQGNDRSLPTCPMCRHVWENESLLTHLRLTDSLEPESVQVYLDWLYSGTVHIDAAISRDTDTYNVCILQAWEVASVVEDEVFKDKIIQTWFTERRMDFYRDTVQWAFVEGRGNDEIRAFVIEDFLRFLEPGWFKNYSAGWPRVFSVALADAALDRMEDHTTYKGLMRKYMAARSGQ
ncbi:hypothetical protein P153DRAFT_422802 [Dothidotthia symphoricarpi CBS 119687]|uniref:RING-type domain-containing protein n=1 Tax=Dothidotthia symphoricarpi CBS 119687 TaxID=1392245 RepID=A0A6A6AGN7_9PLEO|nr:uncharacterized protein P153DRAFT_422802 [Dothidotthia symphoricarpi CBS 119687]KAF2130084.1 hypothetical protein P153DRAFT_422802 [Dothidotthia symphoricarpi CBS 119687]